MAFNSLSASVPLWLTPPPTPGADVLCARPPNLTRLPTHPITGHVTGCLTGRYPLCHLTAIPQFTGHITGRFTFLQVTVNLTVIVPVTGHVTGRCPHLLSDPITGYVTGRHVTGDVTSPGWDRVTLHTRVSNRWRGRWPDRWRWAVWRWVCRNVYRPVPWPVAEWDDGENKQMGTNRWRVRLWGWDGRQKWIAIGEVTSEVCGNTGGDGSQTVNRWLTGNGLSVVVPGVETLTHVNYIQFFTTYVGYYVLKLTQAVLSFTLRLHADLSVYLTYYFEQPMTKRSTHSSACVVSSPGAAALLHSHCVA